MNPDRSLNKVRDYINSGDLDAAQLLTNKILSKKNMHPDAMFLSACVEFLKGNYPKAINLFEKILKKHEGNIIARLNLAIALNETDRPSEAIPHFEKVLEKQPANHQAFYNMGNAYHKLERYQEAKRAYLRAIVINPKYDLAYNNLGVVCKKLDQKEEAIKYFKESIKLNPSSAPYVNLVALLSKENSPQAYLHACEAVNLDKPSDVIMYAYSIFINSCGWDNAEPIREKMLAHARGAHVNTGVLQDLLLTLNCDPKVTPQDIFYLHQRWGAETSRKITPYKIYNKDINTGNKLKIGYLSPDFNDHSVGLFIRNIISAHDFDKFEIYCYSKAKIEDAVTEEIKKHANDFINVSKLSNEKIAARIYKDGIHILVDLAGHTTETAVTALAYRPAPLQMTYLGYPNTTGLDAVDYRITDSYADIDGGTQYTEQLIKMPESFLCFGSFEERPFRATPPAKQEGYVTFGSFNHVRKLTPEVVKAWSTILKRVPKSRLIIKGGRIRWPSVKENIINEFIKNDIDESRIELHPHMDKKDSHLDFYNKIDIALDTFPYNGTTTTCEALWMGVPVVTYVGKVHAQRVSYSILKNIEVIETIGHTVDEYIESAVNYATDLDALENLRNKISGALRRSILCDPQRFARQLEDLYCEVWTQKGNKLPAGFIKPGTRFNPLNTTDQGSNDIELMINAARQDTEQGNLEAAHEKLLIIKKNHPDNPMARFLLGTVKYRLGQFHESIELFKSVIQHDPDNSSVLLNLGTVLHESGKSSEAMECYKKILQKEPGHYLALNNLANVYKKLEQYDEALELLKESIASNSNYWISKFNLGSVLAAKNDHIEAIKWFNKALELEKSPMAYAALIISHVKGSNFTEAYHLARDVMQLKDPDIALVPAWNVFAHMCDFENMQKIQPQVIKILQAGALDNMIRQTALLGLNTKCNIDTDQIYKIHKLWGMIEERNRSPKYQYQTKLQMPRKIRIGYLSGDFNRHSVGYFIRNNIVAHDTDHFEVYCYSSTKTEDHITETIKGSAHKFVDVKSHTPEDIAGIIHDDGVHILIDLAGHTRGTQASALCYRPAPVQISYLGYPNTTGLKVADFRITDTLAETEDGTHYTEQLLYMPESFLCFGVFSDQPINNVLPVENNGFITFGSFNNTTKLTSEVIRVWSVILNRVPGSRLMIKAERANIDVVQQHICQEFLRHDISGDRIEFHGFTEDTESHLAFYNRIDIALDTFPYNGTTTTCEALWMGVPVITLTGKAHAQRVSYSILKNISIEDTIALSEEEYIEKAEALATDIQTLQALHGKIPGKIRTSILCDPERFTRQFEQLLLNAWKIKFNGADLASETSYSQLKGGNIMNPGVNPVVKSRDQHAASTATGLWTDYILKFPYATALSQAWMKYIETHMDDEAWNYHQLALNGYRDACNNELSPDEIRENMKQGYDVLYQLADVKGNVSNLQTFSRIAAELGEYENALFALHYIVSVFESQNEVSLMEPFLCVSERFENINPRDNVGSWVYASVIYQIENIERALFRTTPQDTKGRLEKFKKTGFFDAEMQAWWETADSNTYAGKDASRVIPENNKPRKLHIGGKHAHPEWEIINAVAGPGVDHLGNAKDLTQFPDNSFSELYGSHVLEHFDYGHELRDVLKEWFRVLTPGGKLYISVPDLDKLAALFLNKKQLNYEQRFHVMRMIFGGQVDEYDYHKVGLNQEILEVYLKQAGFENISVVDSLGIFDDTSDYKPYGVAISVNVIAQKPVARQDMPKKIRTANKIIDVFNDDIFLVSYPRSGNTWLRFLLATIVKKAKNVEFDNIQKYAMDIYRNDNDALLKLSRPRIIKSHEIYNPGYPNVIYLIRDFRDVIISCYHYTLKRGNECSFDSCFERLINKGDDPLMFGTWAKNVRSWLSHRDSISIIKYEDLLTEPEKALSELLNKLSISFDSASLSRDIASCSFDKMQKKEQKASETDYLNINEDIKFIRKGIAGGWREYLTPEQIAVIKSEIGDLLIELGYEKDLNWD